MEPETIFCNSNNPSRGTEVLLQSGVHYNPSNSDGVPNPSWIVVTCDPSLISRCPLAYNMNEKSSEGILVARGQLIISDEQPKFDRNRPAIPSTDEELRLNAFDPYSFVPSSSIRTVPFNFHSNCSPFVSHICR